MIEKDDKKVKVNVMRELGYIFDDGDLSMTSTGREKKLMQHGVVVCRLPFMRSVLKHNKDWIG